MNLPFLRKPASLVIPYSKEELLRGIKTAWFIFDEIQGRDDADEWQEKWVSAVFRRTPPLREPITDVMDAEKLLFEAFDYVKALDEAEDADGLKNVSNLATRMSYVFLTRAQQFRLGLRLIILSLTGKP